MPNGYLTDGDMKQIVENGNMQVVVTKAKEAAQHMTKDKDKVTSSQLRNIFGTIKKIQLKVNSGRNVNFQKELFLLIPKLYYASKRANGKLDKLRDDIEGMVKLIGNDTNKFNNFYNYIEAVLAYHKAFEKK